MATNVGLSAVLVLASVCVSCVPYGSVCLRNTDCSLGEVCSPSGTCVVEKDPSDADPEAAGSTPTTDAQTVVPDATTDAPRDAGLVDGGKDASDSGVRDASGSGRTDAADAARTDSSIKDARATDGASSGG